MLERVVFRLFAFLSLLNFAFRRIFPENNLVFFYQHIALVFAIRQAANVGAKVFILAVLPHAKERAICAKANPCLYRLFHHARRRQQLVTHGIIVQRSQHIASPFRTSGLS